MFLEDLLSGGPLILDGAMGSVIQRRGLTVEDYRGSVFTGDVYGDNECLNVTRPDVILDIHRAYIDAGADIITTNSFSANSISQRAFGLADSAPEMAYEAARIARAAADGAVSASAGVPSPPGQALPLRGPLPLEPRDSSLPNPDILSSASGGVEGKARRILVAGSVGPTGRSLTLPSGDDVAAREFEFDDFVAAYRDQVDALIRGGVDYIQLETCFDALNAKALICALSQLGNPVPLVVSATVSDRSGRTLTGQTLEAFYRSVAHAPTLAAFGINCALGAAQMEPLVREIASFSSHPVIFYPNAGIPDQCGNYNDSPEHFAAVVGRLVREGLVAIAGGCCGTTPEHIRALAATAGILSSASAGAPSSAAFADVASSASAGVPSSPGQALPLRGPLPLEPRDSSLPNPDVPSSAAGASAGVSAEFSGLEVVRVAREQNFTNVGERTNVAGSRKFARLIASGAYDEALQVAAAQVDGGASIIDINMDDALLDSTAQMRTFLRYVNSDPAVARAAIMIDSSHWETIVEGLKNVQGRSIVNSISLKDGESEFVRKALYIKSMGAAMVVMAFDGAGQAETFDRKVEICSRSYRLLTEAGIPPSDIIFDANILSIGTGIPEHSRFGVDFIEAVRWIKANLPGALTSGGLSNLSFAFRGNGEVREAMHSAFLYHAIKAGLDMAIVNPQMLKVYDDIEPTLLRAVEDVIFDSDPGAVARLVDIASASAGVPSSPGQVLPLRGPLPLEPRDSSLPNPDIPSSAAGDSADVAFVASADAEDSLSDALVRGREEGLESMVMSCLRKLGSPVAVVEGPLMRGMERVGVLFGDGKMFLPQVVKSAKVMKDAVSILEPYMKEGAGAGVSRPKFVIATVKGDVHDIGKNITAIVLQCSGFDVIDLGVMVPAEDIIDAAVRSGAVAIGVSGLITPSLFRMEELCSLMSARGLSIPLFIGGAASSEAHTELKLKPLYHNVFYGADASMTAVLAKKAVTSR